MTETNLAYSPIQPRISATVSTDSLEAPPTAASQTQELFEDQLENLNTTTYQAHISPKTDAQVTFLINCTSYEGSLEQGIVRADLTPNFWSWTKSLDDETLCQAYVDATLLSGEHSSACANSSMLIMESGIQMDLDPQQLEDLAKQEQAAQNFLHNVYEKKKKSLFKNTLSLKLQKQYKNVIGADLKKDFQVYCMSKAFAARVRQMAEAVEDNSQQKINLNGPGAANIVIALNRLQRLNLQN